MAGALRLCAPRSGDEDFFAHSNFVEFAGVRMGAGYLKGRMSIFDESVFLRRLKRWQPKAPPDWRDLQQETQRG